MIAILDACTLINLLLTVNDRKYVDYIEKVFKEIFIVEKVYLELKDHRNDNEVNEEFKEDYDKLVLSYLIKYIKYDVDKEAIEFVSSSLAYKKENGELLSISYGLYLSRFGSDNNSVSQVLNVYFITDDEPAKEEFSKFYKTNYIGDILSTIDLLAIFCFKGLISRGEVLNYCQSLKFFYNKPIAKLGKELKTLAEKGIISSNKERIIASTIISTINELDDNIINKLEVLLEQEDAKKLFLNHKQLRGLMENVRASNFREKIPTINEKQKELEQVWML